MVVHTLNIRKKSQLQKKEFKKQYIRSNKIKKEFKMDPYKKHIKSEIVRRCRSFDISEIESILRELIAETKIEFYNIKTNKIDPYSIKSIMFISNVGYYYELSFDNIKSEFREFRLNDILEKNKHKI